MKKLSLTIAAMLIAALFCMSAFAGEQNDEYVNAAASYYRASADVVTGLSQYKLNPDDIPVVLYVAAKTHKSPDTLAQLRAQGQTWTQIIRAQGYGPEMFYFILNGQNTSSTYAPIFNKYDTTDKKDWHILDFTDAEIQDLVNLKFIYCYNDYSVYEIMTMRDNGTDFPVINQKVKLIKQEMAKAEKEKLMEVAKDEDNK